MHNPTFIDVQAVEMVFSTRKGSFHALRDIHLQVQQGEFITLIGHSGCGKSTLLNLIAGLLLPTSGLLLCDKREIAAPGPERAVVFQNHSLLPWLTCFANVHLAVERVFGARESKAQLDARTQAALELVGMGHAAQKRPHEISGGMKQRIGIARALAMEPKVLLMDEPFGALDALTRAKLQDELLKIVARKNAEAPSAGPSAQHAPRGGPGRPGDPDRPGCTVVMVTHDVDEAVLLSDRIVMMTNGPAATIGEILTVDLPRPRERVALAEDPTYVHARKSVIEFLYSRHAHVENAA